ncbi:hypothetical protein PSEUDO8O_140228 [Pseudomonas sp. 8O]|nr:hypothetical protein PSEUDO8O_140228 [Pseudomonas sp. 8O]
MWHARLLDSNVLMFTFENMLDEDAQFRYPGALGGYGKLQGGGTRRG